MHFLVIINETIIGNSSTLSSSITLTGDSSSSVLSDDVDESSNRSLTSFSNDTYSTISFIFPILFSLIISFDFWKSFYYMSFYNIQFSFPMPYIQDNGMLNQKYFWDNHLKHSNQCCSNKYDVTTWNNSSYRKLLPSIV